MAILRWKPAAGWTAVGVVAACAITLFYLVGSTALDKEAALWAKALLFVVGVGAIAATMVASDGIPWRSKSVQSWIAPKPVALIFAAVFTAFGVMTDALALFEPRPAVESAPGEIERNVKSIREDLGKLTPVSGADSRILKSLPGLWGEPGCTEVTYRFAVKDQALIVESVKLPPDATPYRLVATIVSAKADEMEVRGESPKAAQGVGARFLYSTNGVTERLVWQDHVPDSAPVELDRCAA